ncbi:MAG: hypothetical protein WBS24_07070 [Terriglobales bacterium]
MFKSYPGKELLDSGSVIDSGAALTTADKNPHILISNPTLTSECRAG